MSNDYTPELIRQIIINLDILEAFLLRTTSELFPVYYQFADTEWFMQEGHTLIPNTPQGTRVPKRDSLHENLLILKTDIDQAMNSLSLEEKIAVNLYYYTFKGEGRPALKEQADTGITKMAKYLNGSDDILE